MRGAFVLISFWLTFVLSLTGWWLYFGASILSQISESSVQEKIVRHQRMLFQEGLVLVFSLLCGGVALFYFSYRMHKEKSVKEKFFASFTHDLKTALFRLQLQLEKLETDVSDDKLSPVIEETRKIHLDLENGLDSTMGENKELFFENVELRGFLTDLHAAWPELSFKIKGGESSVYGDKKAFHSIFKNLLHNSSIHGKADQILINIRKENSKVILEYSDNGNVFEGKVDKLGFKPQHSASGTGLGLYITRYWVERMGGLIHFKKSEKGGLSVHLYLQEGR